MTQLPSSRRWSTLVVAALLIGLVHSQPAAGQSTFATVTGAITDQSGGVLPGVLVTVTNTTTGVVRTAETTSSGEYQVPNLDDGAYLNTLGYDAVRNTRPFLDWNVVTTRANDPRSRYDALGLALTKRISSGFMFDASYTLAKHRSDAGGTVPTAFAAENGATTADLFRGDADYGNVAFTRRHRFVSTFLYQLPLGRGRQFASNIGRGLDALIGGWDVTGVTLFQSGPFLTPSYGSTDPSGTGTTVRGFTATQRPDQIGDPQLDNPTADAFFNRAAYAVPPDNIGRWGNAEVGSLVARAPRCSR